jgi:L-threonylcarbamoyladenylate synthase
MPHRPTRWVAIGDAPAPPWAELARRLRAGEVVAYPTDTLYGLAVDPWNAAAVRRLFDIKGRHSSQAVPLIAADLSQVEAALGRLPALACALAGAFWPGPLTLVVPAPPTMPPELLGGGDSVAVRVPAHDLARDLARALGRPVTATSANRSGEAASADPDAVIAALGGAIDVILDGGRSPGGPPSTIVDARADTPRLVRDGAVPWDRVVQFRPL